MSDAQTNPPEGKSIRQTGILESVDTQSVIRCPAQRSNDIESNVLRI
jgi:hypothetical protein